VGVGGEWGPSEVAWWAVEASGGFGNWWVPGQVVCSGQQSQLMGWWSQMVGAGLSGGWRRLIILLCKNS